MSLVRWRRDSDSDTSGSISPKDANMLVEARPPGDPLPSTPSLWWLLVATSLVAGFGNGYIGNVIYFMLERITWKMTHHELVMAKAASWVGTLCTMLFVPTLADIYGRKYPSIVGETIMILGSVIQTAASNVSTLTVGRLIIGIGMGMCMVLKPLFITELSSTTERGLMIALFNFGYSIGFSAALLANFTASDGIESWRELAFVCMIPPAALIAVMLFLPESGVWLSMQPERQGYQSVEGGQQTKIPGYCNVHLLLKGDFLKSMQLVLPLLTLYQLSGFVWITTDAHEIFSGLFDSSSTNGSIFSGLVVAAFGTGNLISLYLIPLYDRRSILLYGATLYITLLYTLAFSFEARYGGAAGAADVSGAALYPMCTATGLVLCVGIFQATVSPIFWIVISEIFDRRSRSMGMSASLFFGTFLGAVCIAAGSYRSIIGMSNMLFLFASMGSIGALQLLLELPETKHLEIDHQAGDEIELPQHEEPSSARALLLRLLTILNTLSILCAVAYGCVEMVAPEIIANSLFASDFRVQTTGSLYLFGYGSLLNRESRLKSLTFGNTADANFNSSAALAGSNITQGIEMQVRGWSREWNFCAPPPFEFVAVGMVRSRQSNATVSGSAFRVPHRSLQVLDIREEGYAIGRITKACTRSMCEGEGVWTSYVQERKEAIFTYYHKASVSTDSRSKGTRGESSCAGAPIPQSYLDVILGGLIDEHGIEKGGGRGREWLQTTVGWGSTSFVDDRLAPRCMFPLKDARRDTRGKLQPELTELLEGQIDLLLQDTNVTIAIVGGGSSNVSVLGLRKSEKEATGSDKWICKNSSETSTHSCPPLPPW
jgi:MFS family permease